MNRKYNKAIYIAALLITLGVAGCQTKSEESNQQNEAVQASALMEVNVVAVTKDRPSYAVQLPGELKPYESVDIHAKVRGFVKRILVDIGDQVHEGQLLAELEAPEIHLDNHADRANQEKLRTQYIFSKQSYERLQNAANSKKGAISDIELERAYSKFMADSAAYLSALSITERSSQINKYLQIRAPFSGTIVSKNVSAGALVGENNSQSLFTISQNSKLRLTVSVPEIHSNSTYEGIESQFKVMGHPNKEFTAKLSRSSQVLNSLDRSLNLEFDVVNTGGLLRGGDYAEVTIPFQRNDSTFFVPLQSVINTQSGSYVIKVEDGTLQRIKVKTAIRLDDKAEIFGNIKENDVILEKASEELIDGQKVKVKNNEENKNG